MVPCPEQTPLPNRRMSKEARGKIYSVYLRPWTLAKPLATEFVPFLADLAQKAPSSGATGAAQKPSEAKEAPSSVPSGVAPVPRDTIGEEVSTRKAWATYLSHVLPHAERGVRSFMLTCLAEGRGLDDDAEKNRAKGPAVVCNLSLKTVHEAVKLRDTNKDSKDGHVTRLVTQTAQKAVTLSQLTASHATGQTLLGDKILDRQVTVPPPSTDANDHLPAEVSSTVSSKFDNEWVLRYQKWHHHVFKDKTTHTPTEQQKHVLLTIHYRLLKEEYEIHGEPCPQHIWKGKAS